MAPNLTDSSSVVRDVIVLAIHGVGDTEPGEMTAALEATLQSVVSDGVVRVEEFCWNSVVSHSAANGESLLERGKWLSESLVNAAYHDHERKPHHKFRQFVEIFDHVALALGSAPLVIGAVFGGVIGIVAIFMFGMGLVASMREMQDPFHSTVVAVDALKRFGRWLEAYASVLGIIWASFTCLGLLLALVDCAKRGVLMPFKTRLRRTILLSLVPATVSVTFVQVLSILIVGLVVLAVQYLPRLLLLLGIVAVVNFVPNLISGSVTFYAGWLILSVGAGIILVASTGVAVAIIGYLVWLCLTPFRTFVKMILDVSMYFGSPPYRRALQSALDDRLTSLHIGDQTLYIAAHSLGSVIIADSLVNSAFWQPSRKVTLVTFGSPLRRLIWRFLPALYFPCGASAMVSAVSSRVAEFRWANVYRPFDYIGGRLGLSPYGNERCTWQLFRTHTNYWNDHKACAAVLKCLTTHRPITDIQPRPTWLTAATARPPALNWTTTLFATGRQAMGLWFVVGAAAAAIGFGAYNLRAKPMPTSPPSLHPGIATVTHERRFFVSESGTGVGHRFTFEVTTEDAMHHRVQVEIGGLFNLFTLPRFDYSALASYIRASCAEKDGQPDGRWFWTSSRCTRSGIAVMFEPHGAVLVPDFPLRRQQWTVFDWVIVCVIGLFPLMIASWCSVLLFWTMLSWSLLMIGGVVASGEQSTVGATQEMRRPRPLQA